MTEAPALAVHVNGAQLVASAIDQEMTRDPSIVLFGEDVGLLGGVFGATRGLARTHGAQRVFDTPISETAFIGMAVGAAQAGLRPITELMFVDFLGVCFDQILNQMAKNGYMSGNRVRVPLVVRAAVGCIGSAAQHSQVLSATFAHIPGLKVVFPGSHGDLQQLLVASIRDDDPVIFLEHKMLLKSRVGSLPLSDARAGVIQPAELGGCRRVRDGEDITILTIGWTLQLAMQAAEVLALEGIGAGVVDVRTLVPLDREGIVREAAGAPALLVVDEDYADYGMSAELIATIAERLGRHSPRMRRHAVDVPIPANIALERAVVPSVESIVESVRDLLRDPA